MKACPTCERTYADETITFCLVDGSILSAPYDPHETLRIAAPRATDPAPTEILNLTPGPTASRPPAFSTIQAPQPPPLYSAKPQAPLKEQQGGKRWMAIGVALTLFIFATGAILSFIWFGKDREAEKPSNTNGANVVANANARPTPKPSPTVDDDIWEPTPKVEDGIWQPRNEQAGLNGERLTYYPVKTIEKCQEDCAANSSCQAYTYIRPGFYNTADPPMCYLMSVAKEFTPSPCCISAVKR